jgi:hypothetical protein
MKNPKSPNRYNRGSVNDRFPAVNAGTENIVKLLSHHPAEFKPLAASASDAVDGSSNRHQNVSYWLRSEVPIFLIDVRSSPSSGHSGYRLPLLRVEQKRAGPVVFVAS